MATVTIDQNEELAVVVDDPDEPVEALRLERDRDYDGSYEQPLDGLSFEVLLEEPTTLYAKLRATDSTGRLSFALATITAVDAVPPFSRGLVPAGGCACTTITSPARSLAWLGMLRPLLILRRRR